MVNIINNQIVYFLRLKNKFFFRSTMNPPKPSKDKESPGASSSSQVTFVCLVFIFNSIYSFFVCFSLQIGWY